jgi:hypothetical protein
MTFRINDENDPITGPPTEPINWDHLLPPRNAIKGFIVATILSFLTVLIWGLAIYGAHTLWVN